jgi:hypothetical protein
MKNSENFQIIEFYSPKNEWRTIHKIAIFYEEKKLLKLLLFVSPESSIHKKYFFKITFKNKSNKTIAISNKEKNLIKPCIINFNFYIARLIFSDGFAGK